MACPHHPPGAQPYYPTYHPRPPPPYQEPYPRSHHIHAEGAPEACPHPGQPPQQPLDPYYLLPPPPHPPHPAQHFYAPDTWRVGNSPPPSTRQHRTGPHRPHQCLPSRPTHPTTEPDSVNGNAPAPVPNETPAHGSPAPHAAPLRLTSPQAPLAPLPLPEALPNLPMAPLPPLLLSRAPPRVLPPISHVCVPLPQRTAARFPFPAPPIHIPHPSLCHRRSRTSSSEPLPPYPPPASPRVLPPPCGSSAAR